MAVPKREVPEDEGASTSANKRARIEDNVDTKQTEAVAEGVNKNQLRKAQIIIQHCDQTDLQTIGDVIFKDAELRAALRSLASAHNMLHASIIPSLAEQQPLPINPKVERMYLLSLLTSASTQHRAITAINKTLLKDSKIWTKVQAKCLKSAKASIESAIQSANDLQTNLPKLHKALQEYEKFFGDMFKEEPYLFFQNFATLAKFLLGLLNLGSSSKKHSLEGIAMLLSRLAEWDEMVAGHGCRGLEADDSLNIARALDLLAAAKQVVPEFIGKHYFPKSIKMLHEWLEDNS